MKDLLFSTLLPMLVGIVLHQFTSRYKFARDIVDAATRILSSPTNTITDPAKAVEQALIQAHFETMASVVKKLDDQVESGKLEVQSAYERGKAIAAGMDITRVDPATGEETKVAT